MGQNNKSFKVVRHLGLLGPAQDGQVKMASIVQWRDLEQSLDIRKWDGEEPKKGISLREDEIRALCMVLKHEYPEYF